MSLLRTGFCITTLLLSACSLPVSHNTQQSKPIITDPTKITEQDSASPLVTPDSHQDLLVKLGSQSTLANNNYSELSSRVGDAPMPPKVTASDEGSVAKTREAIQRLRSYNSKTSVEISALNARVAERQKQAVHGDLIQIFLSGAKVVHEGNTFDAQPLVGQWVRGESRTIRLKDNLLFESPQSEDLKITFSESYQLLVNDQVIASVNPEKQKNSATFSVNTGDQSGTIVGKLDYRVVNK